MPWEGPGLFWTTEGWAFPSLGHCLDERFYKHYSKCCNGSGFRAHTPFSDLLASSTWHELSCKGPYLRHGEETYILSLGVPFIKILPWLLAWKIKSKLLSKVLFPCPLVHLWSYNIWLPAPAPYSRHSELFSVPRGGLTLTHTPCSAGYRLPLADWALPLQGTADRSSG